MEPVIIQILAEQLAWAVWSHRAEGGYSDEAVAAAKVVVVDSQKKGLFAPSNGLIRDALDAYIASTKEGEQAAGQVEGGEGGVRVWECKSGCCEWKETPLGKFIRHKVRSGWGPWIEWESRADRPHWMTLKLRELHDPEKDAAMKEGA